MPTENGQSRSVCRSQHISRARFQLEKKLDQCTLDGTDSGDSVSWVLCLPPTRESGSSFMASHHIICARAMLQSRDCNLYAAKWWAGDGEGRFSFMF